MSAREWLVRECGYAWTFWKEIRSEWHTLVSFSAGLLLFISSRVPALAVYAPSLEICSAIAFILAVYLVWRRKLIEAEPKLSFLNETRTMNRIDFEVAVQNSSKTSLGCPGVTLVRSEPPLCRAGAPIGGGTKLRVNRRSNNPVSLNPGEEEWFVLVSRNSGTGTWELHAQGAVIPLDRPQKLCRLLLRGHATNASTERWFVFDAEQADAPIWPDVAQASIPCG
jgi:hypothetical protein